MKGCAIISGILIALASEIARKYAGIGALIASLLLVSVLCMIWLWHGSHDPARLANHAQATLWFVAPSLPMFVVIPMLLRTGYGFLPALGMGCVITILLYLVVVWLGPRLGINI